MTISSVVLVSNTFFIARWQAYQHVEVSKNPRHILPTFHLVIKISTYYLSRMSILLSCISTSLCTSAPSIAFSSTKEAISVLKCEFERHDNKWTASLYVLPSLFCLYPKHCCDIAFFPLKRRPVTDTRKNDRNL
jgi:hypothetical protein